MASRGVTRTPGAHGGQQGRHTHTWRTWETVSGSVVLPGGGFTRHDQVQGIHKPGNLAPGVRVVAGLHPQLYADFAMFRGG